MFNGLVRVNICPKKYRSDVYRKSGIFVQKLPDEVWNPADPLKVIHGVVVIFWLFPIRTAIMLVLVGNDYHPYSEVRA